VSEEALRKEHSFVATCFQAATAPPLTPSWEAAVPPPPPEPTAKNVRLNAGGGRPREVRNPGEKKKQSESLQTRTTTRAHQGRGQQLAKETIEEAEGRRITPEALRHWVIRSSCGWKADLKVMLPEALRLWITREGCWGLPPRQMFVEGSKEIRSSSEEDNIKALHRSCVTHSPLLFPTGLGGVFSR